MPCFPTGLETRDLLVRWEELSWVVRGAWRTTVHDQSFIYVQSINPDFTQEERGTFGEGQERAFKTNCSSACFKVAAWHY